MQIRDELRRFIAENFLFGRNLDLKDDASFLDNDIIDSTGVLELVTFLEDHFGITVRDQDLIPENLDSIDSVIAFVQRQSGSARGAA